MRFHTLMRFFACARLNDSRKRKKKKKDKALFVVTPTCVLVLIHSRNQSLRKSDNN